MASRSEKGAAGFEGIKLLLCENPLPPIEEAIEAAQAEARRGNFYTEAYSAPLRGLISERLGVPEHLIHINAGSELILRQLFDRLGQQVHLLTPTYPLFPEISRRWTEAPLRPEDDFGFDLAALEVPAGTTLVAIVNPNNPTGRAFEMSALPGLLTRHPMTYFLVDEAFIDVGGRSVVHLVSRHDNLLVTRTLSKAHRLAGFRVGYAVLPSALADDLNAHNDAYPLARPSQAAALATLRNEEKIAARVATLRTWAADLAVALRDLGVRTFPSDAYFFLADFAPHDADVLAAALREQGILVKPLNSPRLGPGYMRVTTAQPHENRHVIEALAKVLSLGAPLESGLDPDSRQRRN